MDPTKEFRMECLRLASTLMCVRGHASDVVDAAKQFEDYLEGNRRVSVGAMAMIPQPKRSRAKKA